MKKIIIPSAFIALFLSIYFVFQVFVAIVYVIINAFTTMFQAASQKVPILSNDELTKKLTDSVFQNMSYILMISIALSLMLYLLIFRLRKIKIKEIIQISSIPVSNYFYAIILGITINFLLDIPMGFLSEIEAFKGTFESYNTMMSELFSGNPIILLITVGVLGPIFEEILFRGIVFRELKLFCKPTLALIIQAVIFGVYHMNPVQSSYAIVLGLIMGFVYEKTKSLIVPILFHIAINSSSSVLSQGLGNDFITNNQILIYCICFLLFVLTSFLFVRSTTNNRSIKF